MAKSAWHNRLYIVGAGGFSLQMLDTLDGLASSGVEVVIADDSPLAEMSDYPVVPIDEVPSGASAVIAISRPETRRIIAERRPDIHWTALQAATAIVSRTATIAPGAIIAHGAIIEANCQVGRHFHANLYSYAAHECVIGDYVTFSPRVSCNGNVHICDGVFLGTGAMIRQGSPSIALTIGVGAFIGMGAIVTRDVPPGAVVKAATST